MLFKLIVSALVATATVVVGKPCKPPIANLHSMNIPDTHKVKVIFTNTMLEDAEVYWINFEGTAVFSGLVGASGVEVHNSHLGHAFRVKDERGNTVHEVLLRSEDEKDGTINIKLDPCGDGVTSHALLYGKGRDEEFKKITHKQDAKCEGDKSEWSCVRHVSKEEIAARPKEMYGFAPEEVPVSLRSGRRPYQTRDDTYFRHIPGIPHLTPNEEGNGFLKMNMTKLMQDTLFEFYRLNVNTSTMTKHEPVSGYYSNIHAVDMDKIDLDRFTGVRRIVVKEMQQILQWWTLRKLAHTSTFGSRIYRKGSMLINHVDRADTHLASAVLQVAQNCPKGQGWPLEVESTAGELYEVYLQPGEMVLYEGARLFHGRPSRSNCTEFANIFSHFAPVGFKGPHENWDHTESVVPGVKPRVTPHKDL